ncbi:hypothetical protein [Streptomyces sp. NBC_00503]|uniref:hypothetical protein n=1 Tax=Streptomyces sp. NBC_00503 TaxID=2903659 RepID=UPI002E804E9D|nr:hypothetical protein [Streptomyces sp. NBC_00503]WUD86466.1 hypothetical protein OG490_38315 [Streptomyces sp. NBC_00503]
MSDPFEHLDHPLLHQQVRDIASGTHGKLMAVVREEVRRVCGDPEYARIAYIRMPSGRELTTAIRNIEASG